MRLDHGKHRGPLSLRRRKIGATRRRSRLGLEALEGRTLLASRLFALPLTDTTSIVELNPNTGAEVNRLAAPVASASDGENGLAFDGQVLYYMPTDGTDRLWELNPDTGAVLKSAVITAGSGHFDGLGAVDGKVYLQDDLNHDLVIVDPTSETVVGQLNVVANLIGGLTGADHPSELVGTENFNTAVFIDPVTGNVLGRSALPGQVEGAAFVNGDFYFGSSQSGGTSPQGGEIYVTDRAGNLLRTLYTAFPVSGLGGDGEATAPQQGTEQVVNGGFELGTLQGWTKYNEPGSTGDGFQVYQGPQPFQSPLPAPPQGTFAAANNQSGPGTDILYQDVTLPAGSTAHLSMLVTYANRAGGFIAPGTLDSQTPTLANQQFRIDIVKPTADLLSTAAGDVLLNVFQTKAGDPNTFGPTEVDADLSALEGQTVRLRIAVADNEFYLNAAVDAVSIQTEPIPPPPPPTWYYVADPEGFGGGTGEIVRVDPNTGAQTVISSGGQFVDPYGVAVAPDGSLIVADHGTFGGTGTILRVDPSTGAQSVITTGGYLVDPSGIAFAPDGGLLIADFGGAEIVRVDPATGQQAIVSKGGLFSGPFGIATSPDGTIYVADFGPFPGASGAVFRVDPATGAQAMISMGGRFVDPSGILVAPDGSLIVSDSNAIDGRGAIFRVDPQTGAQAVISQDGQFQEPVGEAFAPDGSLLVADADAAGGAGALIRVDLTTGAQTIVSSGGYFLNPLGVAISTGTTPVSTPPTAGAGGPYTVEEGATITLDASGTIDPSQDPSTLTYLWDLNGDGVFGETGPAATNGDEVGLHPTFSAAGLPGGSTRTIQLEVIDAQGHMSTASATITIENLPPVVTLAPGATVDAGATFTIQGSFTDPGAGENFTGGVDYGDGAGDQWLPLNPDHTLDLSHVYEQAGTHTVVVYVGDGNGGLGQATLEVTVNPIAPAFDSLAGASITYGQDAVTLGGHIGGAALVPSGSVAITLDGITQAAAIDPATGDFSTTFSTATLGVQGSPYAVTYSYAGDGTYTAISDGTQAVTVSPRALTITAQDATKTYGDADPAFSVVYDGFADGEDPGVLAGTLGFSTSEPIGNAPVGVYSIKPIGLSSPNYTISVVTGKLTVTPRALTVTADDATKIYGQPDPTFGTIGSGFAPGEGLNNLGGTLQFVTSEPDPLTAPAGTYAITPSGLASPNYSIAYVPGTLTVKPAATTLTASSVAPVVVGTPSVMLSGVVGSNSVLPVGQAVTVAIVGASGTLASGSGMIGTDGRFTASVDTSSLPVGSYTIRYAYAGDADFTGSGATGTMAVTYAVTPLYDPTRGKHAGSADPIKISIGDASGDNLSSPGLVVTAVQIVDANGNVFTPVAKGGSNSGSVFRETGSSYTYNLDTSGLAPGTYTLFVTVGNDPVKHALTFVVS